MTALRTEPLADPILSLLESTEQQRVMLLAFREDRVEAAALAPGEAVVVGRAAPADLVLDDRNLSRRHVRVVLRDDRALEVEDLGSTNGTWIGGKRVQAARIAIGEDVRIGGTILRAQLIGERGGAEAEDWTRDDVIVAGEALRPVLDMAERAASSRIPVLLQGETGTGKEVVARVLHARGPRADRRMVAVNCAAIPGTLLESTLFGHEKGAFTGAASQHRGVFEEAHGGTVFLDEVGELSAPAQAALLRVLEAGRFCRVGSMRELDVDVRVVAATHRDLEAASERGDFRRDLFYRLSAMVIAIPPLRSRKDEIAPLAERFLSRANRADGRSVRGLTKEAMDALRAHDWPGNVRELRNAVERAVVVARGDLVRPEDLPPRVLASRRTTAPTPAAASQPRGAGASSTVAAEHDTDCIQSLGRAGEPLPERVQGFEKRLIRDALEASGWNRAEAARLLGVPLRTLAYRIRTLGIEEPDR